jgi:hypothetical protein
MISNQPVNIFKYFINYIIAFFVIAFIIVISIFVVNNYQEKKAEQEQLIVQEKITEKHRQLKEAQEAEAQAKAKEQIRARQQLKVSQEANAQAKAQEQAKASQQLKIVQEAQSRIKRVARVKEEYLSANINIKTKPKVATGNNFAVLVWDQDKNLNLKLMENVRSAIPSRNVNTQLFRSEFVKNGNAEKVFSSDDQPIIELKLNQYADYLILGKLDVTINEHNDANRGLVGAHGKLSINIVETKTGNNNKSFTISERGGGFSQRAAKDMLEKELNKKVFSILSSLEL